MTGPVGSSSAPRTVLVIAPNWLGDLVMSSVILSRLAADDVRVVVAVRRRWLPVLDGDPRIHDIVVYERTGRHRGWRGNLRLARELAAVGADSVLVLPPSWRSAAVAAAARIHERVGWPGEGRSPLLTRRVPRSVRGTRHYCDEMEDLWRAWRGIDAAGAPDATLPSVPAIATAPSTNRHDTDAPTTVLAVGATYGDAKSWPPALAARFASGRAARGERVLVMGDAAARDHVDTLGTSLPHGWTSREEPGSGVVDLAGATSLEEAAALLGAASLFVGNDSGLMHLAAALGTPTLGLFGSTNPAWTGPRGPRAAALGVEGFACSPCHRRTCPEPTFCLETLTPEAVDAAVERLLREVPA